MWIYKPPTSAGASTKLFCISPIAKPAPTFVAAPSSPNPAAKPSKFNAARWAGSLGYFHQSTREALEIIRRLRKMTHQLLIALPEEVWDTPRTSARWRNQPRTLGRNCRNDTSRTTSNTCVRTMRRGSRHIPRAAARPHRAFREFRQGWSRCPPASASTTRRSVSSVSERLNRPKRFAVLLSRPSPPHTPNDWLPLPLLAQRERMNHAVVFGS